MDHLPAIGSPLEITLDDGRAYRLIVSERAEYAVTVTLPDEGESSGPAEPETPTFDPARTVAVGWLVGRCWYMVPGRTVKVSADDARRWHVTFADGPNPTNRRQFVRGGGGEPIEVLDVDPEGTDVPVAGIVVDLSEVGLRCRLPALSRTPGETMHLRLSVSGQVMAISGSLYEIRVADGPGVEAVVVFTLSEADATVIRRYLYQREIADRRAKRD